LRKKALVRWRLDAEEHALALDHMVRIRRLLRYELAGGSKASAGGRSERKSRKSSSNRGTEVRELLFDHIDIQLRMLGGGALPLAGGRLRLGSGGAGGQRRAAIASLHVSGRVGHRPRKQGRSSLAVAAERLFLGLEEIAIGKRTLDIAALHLGAIEDASVAFVGLRPGAVQATLRDLAIDELLLAK
jgi:hypothetical protein